jgi:hypothetical protein
VSEAQCRVGALVVVSSASVYRDAAGRTLDEAAASGFPELPVPIPETQPTLEPGSTRKPTRKGPDTFSPHLFSTSMGTRRHVELRGHLFRRQLEVFS